MIRTQPVVTIIVLLFITVGTFFLAGSVSSNQPGLTYFALGDSIASGNASPGLSVRPCQRDDRSYAVIVANMLDDVADTSFHHLACSGARIVNEAEAIQACYAQLSATTDPPQTGWADCELKSLRNQVSEVVARIDDSPTLVTITIAANDTGWTDPLAIVGLLLASDDVFRARIDEIAESIGNELDAEIERLLVHDQVTIILTDYYNPLNPGSTLYALMADAQAVVWGAENVGNEPCTGVDLDDITHELSCAERFEYALQAVNRSLATATETDPSRVLLASVIEQFRGHEAPAEACGDAKPTSGESWIRGLVETDVGTQPDCFHPNALGMTVLAEEVIIVWNARNP